PLAPTVVALSTNDHTPVITGTATVGVGETFTVIVNGITYTLGDGNLSIDGNNWTLQIPAGSELADGTYSVTATVKDAANNSSSDVTANELVIDTTAPLAPTVVALSTNDHTPVITGTATVGVGETFTVTVNGISYTLGDGNLSIDGNNWTLQIPAESELADGTYSVTATVKDAANNSSADITANELVIDTTAPEVPTVNVLKSNDSTPAITGTATVNAGDVFTVTVNGITYILGDGNLSMNGNNWTLQIPAADALTDGTYSVTATVMDAIGNLSNDITTNEVEIKTTAPEVPTVNVLKSNDSTPAITGTATVNAGDVFTVTVNGITYTLGDGNLILKINNWTLQIPSERELANGIYSVTAVVTDAFGNSSEDQTKDELTIKNSKAPLAIILGSPLRMLGRCSTDLQLDASASSGDGLIYQWTPSIYLDNPSSSKPKFHPGSTTRYLLTVTDSEGQTDTASVRIVIADAPKAVTDKNVFVNTPEANIVLNGSPSTGVGLTYQWSAKEGHVLTGENQPAATVNGLGTYYLQVKDSYGCTSRDSVTVGLYVQAMSDTTEITVNESVTINVLRNDLPHGALDPSSITIVTPPSHGVASMAADSLIIYQPETSYTGQDEFVYQVCDYAGLCDNATVLVLVNDLPLFIPEAFSPNGDAINDRFVIKGLEKYTRVEIEIFNRWGNIVYQSPNYGEGEGRDGYWNGMASSGLRIESGPVPSGTYYFILKMNGQKNISGSLYLDR
ncbi:MAG TPA: Ig-like domain-containing protein, partial [Prolixibacteraceae bacterium]|nr:Ig-like domain-containing protein [Prolixibacteraceae bacterium]